MEIRRINISSVIRISIIVGLFIGLITGSIYGIIAGLTIDPYSGLLIFAITPFVYALMICFISTIYALLYNMAAKNVGGVILTTR